jgi:hypothetical protein
MKGQIVRGKKPLSMAFIRIYADSSSSLSQKIQTDNEGWVAFQLQLDKFYTIKISKPGYVTKIITVDAHLNKHYQTGDYYFEFGMDLFEEIEGLDVSMLRDPIAKVFFNTFTKKFDYDYNYTATINSNLDKLYKNYKSLKKKDGDTPPVKQTTEADTEKVQVQEPVKVIQSGPKIIYSVDIITSDEQVPHNSPRFKGIIAFKEVKEGDNYKYYVGEYPSLAEAEKMKERILGYFPDAKVAAFKEGQKITLEEAAGQK